MREASGEKKYGAAQRNREKDEEFGGGGSRSNIANDVCAVLVQIRTMLQNQSG